MAFAKKVVFGTIRAVRAVGSVGLFAFGLVLGAVCVAVLAEMESVPDPLERPFVANAAGIDRMTALTPRIEEPWSRVLGGQQFEKVTDVAMIGQNDIAFAGLTLGVGNDAGAHAMLVRTGAEGFVHSQMRLESERVGSVSRVILDEHGVSRLIHWVGETPAFAMADMAGTVIWSREFSNASSSAWAEVADARGGETLIALFDDGGASRLARIMRLDATGSVIWRHDLDANLRPGMISMEDSGDGGALIALETLTDAGVSISLKRINRRGQQAWTRPVTSGSSVRLADTRLDGQGSVLLVSGAPSSLFRYDGLGQLSWVRDLPALNAAATHIVEAAGDGAVQIIAEPRTSSGDRRHWIARYTADGRQDWATTRANRLNATFEAAEVIAGGNILAGGSLVTSTMGDTDMLMVRVGAQGAFPQGLDASDIYTPPVVMASATTTSNPAVMSASLALDETAELRRAPDPVTSVPPSVDMQMASAPVIESASLVTASETQPAKIKRVAVREVSAPVSLNALTPASTTPSKTLPSISQPAVNTPAASVPLSVDEIEAVVAETVVPVAAQPAIIQPQPRVATPPVPSPRPAPAQVEPASMTSPASRTFPAPQRASDAHTYQCTYTCLAESEDVVKYPVDRIYRDVTEGNAALVSLDLMAMDEGVCLASGGVVFEEPRLPPVCNRLN